MKVSEIEGKLKVGDMVEVIDEVSGYVGEISEDAFYVWQNNKDGGRGNISPETKGYKFSWCVGFYHDDLEIKILITNNKTMENVKEKFVALFIKEPEKTFRKAGITNGDGFLTEEGQSVFLGYLLNKYGVEFKKEVVDEIVKEEKGDK